MMSMNTQRDINAFQVITLNVRSLISITIVLYTEREVLHQDPIIIAITYPTKYTLSYRILSHDAHSLLPIEYTLS